MFVGQFVLVNIYLPMEYSAVLYSYVFYSSLCMTQVCCDRTFPPSNCLRTIASMFLSAKEIIARTFSGICYYWPKKNTERKGADSERSAREIREIL